MPTVATSGQFKFKVYTRENANEPPHVHVWIGNENVCRIELNGAMFLEDPPPGMQRQILDAYAKFAVAIRAVWDEIHGR